MNYEVVEWSNGWSVLGRDLDGTAVWESRLFTTEDEAWELFWTKQGCY